MLADLFDALVSMTLAGSLALICVLIARVPVRRWFGAQTAYATWIVVPLVVIATLLPAPLANVKTVMTFAQHAATASGPVIALQTSVNLRPALLIAWVAGALAMLAWLVGQQRLYLRSLGPLRVLKGDTTHIVQSDSLAGGPALVGALRPRIVLPADFASRYAPHERELILAHEHEHLARGDARINALVAAVRCLNWFNPLVHFASAVFRFDQELACDAAVISRFPEARRPYADAMLKTQLIGQSPQELRLPVGCSWPSGHPLKERIAMLKHPLPTRAKRAVGALLVATFCASGGYLTWVSQPARAAVTSAASANGVDVRLSLIGVDRKNARVEVTADAVRAAHTTRGESQPVLADETLFVGFGRPLQIAYGNPGDRRVVTMTAQPHDDDSIEARFALTHEDQLVSEPSMIVRDNQPARMTVDGSGSTAAFDGFDLAFTVARTNGSADVGTELADPVAVLTSQSAQVDSAASQSATYRRLKRLDYPAVGAATKAEAVVYVMARVEADGRVSVARGEIEPEPTRLATDIGDAFLQAAVSGVKSWTFNPAKENGTAIASDVVVPVQFTAHPEQSAPIRRQGTMDAIFVGLVDPASDADANPKAPPPPPPPPPPPLPPPPRPPLPGAGSNSAS